MQVQRLLGALPGYHAHTRSCDLYLLLGALAGAALCALGAAIVAVLVLRAQSEWRRNPPPPSGRVPAPVSRG
jgi:hypothetical protein